MRERDSSAADLDNGEPIYLDHQATTPLDPRVFDAMLPFLGRRVGNPHSSSHHHGRQAFLAVEDARAAVASLIGADPSEVVFTSGATESNNMLLRGAVSAGTRLGRSDVVTLSTEHRAVLDVVAALGREGRDVIMLGVDRFGLVDVAEFTAALSARTAVASIMTANNEIGVIQPISELAVGAHQAGALFHTDAAQAIGRVPINVRELGIDLMSLSAHKLYGPMGIGAAFIASDARRRIDPLILGGGQQGGLRSGTLPVALCVGFGEACRICAAEMEAEAVRVTMLRDTFLQILRESIDGFELNGAATPRLPGNINLSFEGVDAEALLMRIRDRISISAGSACTAESLEPSHVVLALGFGAERAESAIRISLGRTTTAEEVSSAARFIAKAVARLRSVGYTLRTG